MKNYIITPDGRKIEVGAAVDYLYDEVARLTDELNPEKLWNLVSQEIRYQEDVNGPILGMSLKNELGNPTYVKDVEDIDDITSLKTQNYIDTQRQSAVNTINDRIDDEVDTLSGRVDAVDSNLSGHVSNDGSDHTFIDQDVTSGSSPTLDGNNFTGIDADDVDIADVSGFFAGTEVETALQEVGRETAIADSPMVISGGEISVGAGATFTVAALTAFLRSGTGATDPLVYVTLAEQANQSITSADTKYHVILTYGDPCTITISESSANGTTAIGIGNVTKDSGGNVHFTNGGMRLQNGVAKLHRRAATLRTSELAKGCAISYQAIREFTMTAGVVYHGINRLTPFVGGDNKFDSAVDKFIYVWRNGGVWQYTTDSTVIDDQHYDDNTADKGDIANGKYGCHWVYLHPDDEDVYVVYGRDSYKLAEAEVAQEPTIPPIISTVGLLLGRIVIQKGGTSFQAVHMVSDTFFTGTSLANHNELGSLQGGTENEYYHLTSAQHSEAHDRYHDINSAADHGGVSGTVEDNFVAFDGSGLLKDSGYNSSDFSDIFDVTQLEGYGTKATATGDDDIDITSALCPFLSDDPNFYFKIGTQKWNRGTTGVGLFSGATSAAAPTTGAVRLSPDGASWHTTFNTTYYADVSPGFYWICFPGVGGTSVKFWWDRSKVYDAVQGKSGDVYIDQAGCLWYGDPESGGTFICGPTMEDGFGINTFNVHLDANQDIADAIVPMIDNTSITLTTENAEFACVGVGTGKTYSGQSGGIRHNDSYIKLEGYEGDNTPWSSFADASTGMYYFNFPYSDGSNNIEGTAAPMWYDEEKFTHAFLGYPSNTYAAYIDQLGNVWKGDPGSGGEFVCGPYGSVAYSDYAAHNHNHSDITDDEQGQHREIHDDRYSSIDLWSAEQISGELDNKSNTSHLHTESDVIDLQNYAVSGHPHSELSDDEPEKHREIHDDRHSSTDLWSAEQISGEVAGGGGAKPDQVIKRVAGSFDYPDSDLAPLNTDGTNVKIKEQLAGDSADESILGQDTIASDLNTGGTVTITVWVKATTAPGTSKNVVHILKYRGIGNTEDFDQALLSKSSGAKAIGTVTDGVYQHSWTETVANMSLAANDFFPFGLVRDADNGSDNLSGDLGYLALEIRIPRT